MKYNLKLIRNLINKALTPEEFDDLVFYSFRDVYKQFTSGQCKSLRVRILLDYIEKYAIMDDLLHEIQEINPKAFNEFEACRQEQTNLLDSRNKEEKAINNLGKYLQDQSFKQLKDIYLLYRSEKADEIVDNIDHILTDLNRIVPKKKYRLIIPFVVGIKQEYTDSNLQKFLDKWLEKYGNFFGYSEFQETAKLNFRQSSPNSKNRNLLESYLLIEFKKKNSSSLQMQGWFWSSKENCYPIQEQDLIKRKDLPKKLTELIEEFNTNMDKSPSYELKIDLFLDNALLMESQFFLDLQVKRGSWVRMCEQYIVNFRLAQRLERRRYGELEGKWNKKWENLKSNKCTVVDYCSTKNSKLWQDQIVGIKLNNVSDQAKFFNKIFQTSMPVALWSSCNLQTISCQNEIDRILGNVKTNLNQLPEKVCNERRDSENIKEHIGSHICLLWDNPERMPPDPSNLKYALSY